MATQKYGKVRIGQATGSESGVSFDLWVSSDFVTNSGFDRWGFAERNTGWARWRKGIRFSGLHRRFALPIDSQ
jgi:hypothetical protein